MMKEWQVYSLLAVLIWGVWGFLSKLSVDKLGSLHAYLAFSLGALILPIFIMPFVHLPSISISLWIAIITGFLGGIGTFLLSRAFVTGRANVVIPITAQYILITVFIATAFYREPLTLTKIAGIALSVAAIILLSI